MCEQIFQILGAKLVSSPEAEEGSENVRQRTRVMIILALILGLVAAGALAIATSVEYWIFTHEPYVRKFAENMNETMYFFHFNAGLWRGCYYCEGLDPPTPPLMHECFEIEYKATYKKRVADEVDGKPETSWAIFHGRDLRKAYGGIRKASPLVIAALLVIVAALICTILGNSRNDSKTLVGAVLYIVGALILALGAIFFISAVNDEVAHRKPPEDSKIPLFEYKYGWAFHFAGSSFITSMSCAVINITLYLKRYANLEDMVMIIPGLDHKGHLDMTKEEETRDEHLGDYEMQNPTIIL